MKKISVILGAVIICAACAGKDKAEITGGWVQPVPGQEEHLQGFRLEEGGKAASVNMYTLLCESWEVHGDMLILKGKSIGTGQTIEFSDTARIEKLTADSLVLVNRGYRSSYSRLPSE